MSRHQRTVLGGAALSDGLGKYSNTQYVQYCIMLCDSLETVDWKVLVVQLQHNRNRVILHYFVTVCPIHSWGWEWEWGVVRCKRRRQRELNYSHGRSGM